MRWHEPAATTSPSFRAHGRIARRDDLATDLPNVRVVDQRLPVRALNLDLASSRWPPVEALTGGDYDIAHSPHPLLLPSRSAAQIVTIHDLHFLTHPERTSQEIRRDYPALAALHARRADRIIVSSRFAAGEVQRLLNVAVRENLDLSCRRTCVENAARERWR